jgi:hypothetical protein
MALPSKETIVSEKERFPIVERPTVPEINEINEETPQIETIVGEEISLPQPITDDNSQVVVDNVVPQQIVVKLPLTEQEMNRALHLKLVYSLRWLAEWTKRLIKIVGGKFIYKYN